MNKDQRLNIRCPDCGSDITVDLTSGQVVFHTAKHQTSAAGKDFDRLLAGLDESKARADEVFQREMAALEDQDRLMEEKFREAMRRSKEEPEQDPPIRPWDLD